MTRTGTSITFSTNGIPITSIGVSTSLKWLLRPPRSPSRSVCCLDTRAHSLCHSGNISWGHAESKDLVIWTDVTGWRDTEALALGPGPVGSYDGLGVFSGTAQPVNLN